MEAKDLLMLALTSVVSLCAALLSVILWLIRRALNEMRDRWVQLMAEVALRVADSLCIERRKTCPCVSKADEVVKDFKLHTHTGLPSSSELMILEK